MASPPRKSAAKTAAKKATKAAAPSTSTAKPAPPAKKAIRSRDRATIDTPLSDAEKTFVAAYMIDRNGAAAYRAVRPNATPITARVTGSQWLSKPNVRAAVDAAIAKLNNKLELTAERTLREIARLAYFDPRKLLDPKGNPLPLNELDDDTAAAIAGLEVQSIELGSGENALPAVVKKYKLADKKGALDMAAKHLGLFKEDNKQRTDPLTELLGTLKGSTLPVNRAPAKGSGR